MATPLQNLQAEYANICQQLADLSAGVHPDYSEDGTSIQKNAYADSLRRRMMELMKIPGIAPDQSPVFDVYGT